LDRLLRPLRQTHGLSATKPGRLLKKQILIRTFTEWSTELYRAVRLDGLPGGLVFIEPAATGAPIW